MEMGAARLGSCLPLLWDDKTLSTVIEEAKDWALMHGAGLRDRNHFTKESLQVAPFVLLPSSFPRKEFYKAVELQTVFNELMHKVAHDANFLEQSLKHVIEVDDFTARLYHIWQTVREEGIAQPISLGILRSDTMLEYCPASSCEGNHPFHYSSKQVEMNNIACGFGHFGPISREIQRYTLRKLGHGSLVKNMPSNRALSGICGGIIEAFDLYGNDQAVVLFVVEELLHNIADEMFHEFELSNQRSGIKILKKTLAEIYDASQLNSEKQLIIEGWPVAVVYYRAGYSPAHYPASTQWDARLRLERSNAIKCPPIQYQLAGTKKVQQALAMPGAVETFLGTGPASRIRDMFTGLYSLDFDDNGEKAVQMALDDPERFVLKPQREGGGNNIFGPKVKEVLTRLRHSPERASYILMERIFPPLVSGYVIRPGAQTPPPATDDLVSELGVFGLIIGSKDKIISNKQVGHMMRTKSARANEVGIFAGYGALDSPYLVDI